MGFPGAHWYRIHLPRRRRRFNPWVRKIPWRRKNGNPLQYSCMGNPMDRGVSWAAVHGVAKELDMTLKLNNNTTLTLYIILLIICVPLGKLFNLAMPQFPFL